MCIVIRVAWISNSVNVKHSVEIKHNPIIIDISVVKTNSLSSMWKRSHRYQMTINSLPFVVQWISPIEYRSLYRIIIPARLFYGHLFAAIETKKKNWIAHAFHIIEVCFMSIEFAIHTQRASSLPLLTFNWHSEICLSISQPSALVKRCYHIQRAAIVQASLLLSVHWFLPFTRFRIQI